MMNKLGNGSGFNWIDWHIKKTLEMVTIQIYMHYNAWHYMHNQIRVVFECLLDELWYIFNEISTENAFS